MSESHPLTRATSRGEAAGYVITFAILLSAPALVCFFRGVVADPDVWWHLKAGQWMLQHRQWPTADTFSWCGAGRPWTAYSWVPEVVLCGLYKTLGLRGLVLYTAALSAAIVAAFHLMVRRLQPNAVVAAVLTLVAVLGLTPLLTPRPWLLSILCFVIELDVLLTAGRTGSRRLLLWLVPLFVLWANAHIQFVLGLFVLGLAVAESVFVRTAGVQVAEDESGRLSAGWMMLIFALCVGATLINPYHYHLYAVALHLVGQSQLWNVIQELGAMPFRSSAHWAVLAVAMAAAFAMGWRRRIRLLLLLLFVAAAYCSFRSLRDVWLVLLVGLTILAYAGRRTAAPRWPMPARCNWGIAGIVACVLLGGALLISERKLEEELAGALPVRAVEFIRAEACPGPMFNSFGWGGYLIFGLPELPVNIDGRTMVHGQQRVIRHFDTLRGRETWRDDPDLVRARLVVVPRNVALAALLKLDPRFRLIYEDSVAVVFDVDAGSLLAGEGI